MWRLCVCVATGACAHGAFEPRIEPYGPYQPPAALAEAARALAPADLSAVSVWRGPLPPGLILDEETLRVTDHDRYEILGRLSARFDPQRALLASLGLTFYRYDPPARNVWCNVQVPLGWVTLGLWSAVPLHYPCLISETNGPGGENRRKDQIVEALVRGTRAAGGNLLVITEIRDAGGLVAAEGVGFAVRDRAL